MKFWMVEQGEYEGRRIVGVYATEALAQEHQARHNALLAPGPDFTRRVTIEDSDISEWLAAESVPPMHLTIMGRKNTQRDGEGWSTEPSVDVDDGVKELASKWYTEYAVSLHVWGSDPEATWAKFWAALEAGPGA